MTTRSIWSIGSWFLSTGSWLFPTTTEDWLKYHRRLRDIGSIILIVGVIAELVIDEFWEIRQPPLLRGRKATTLLTNRNMRLKRCAMLFTGILMVGGGITLEWWQGTKADNVVDSWRIQLLQAIEPKSLSEKDQTDITNACKALAKGVRVRVTMTMGPQGLSLGLTLWRALKDAGFDMDDPVFTHSLEYEVGFAAPLEYSIPLTCLTSAIGKRVGQMGVTRTMPNGSPIEIIVGERELGKLPQ